MYTLIINFSTDQSNKVQKKIQAVLVEQKLYSKGGVKLECEK